MTVVPKITLEWESRTKGEMQMDLQWVCMLTKILQFFKTATLILWHLYTSAGTLESWLKWTGRRLPMTSKWMWWVLKHVSSCPESVSVNAFCATSIPNFFSFKVLFHYCSMSTIQICSWKVNIFCKSATLESRLTLLIWHIFWGDTLLPRYNVVRYNAISDTMLFFLGPQIIFKKYLWGLADKRNSSIFAHIGKQVHNNLDTTL